MKIAVLLCGHIRTWEECKDSFFNFFPSDIDIFIHTYTQQYRYHPYIQGTLDLTNDINDLKVDNTTNLFNLKNFKKVVIEEELTEEDVDLSEYPINLDVYSQIRKVKLCNELRKEWEKENNIKYDIVIKTRFDVCYQGIINLNIDFNKIYYLSCNETLEPSDVCYLSSAKNFDILIEKLTKTYQNKIINPHIWLKLCIDSSNLQSQKLESECYVKRFLG
jgi:hypothetical protein